MKRYINRLMVAGAALLTLASCDDNAWNDDLDGFEEPRPQDVQKINYTLTPADYKLIANSSTNKALAGEALAADLAAVGTQCYFTDKIDPLDYIPALLSDPTFPYFALSDRSAIKVTYQTMGEQPAQVTGVMAAPKYTVAELDYKEAWDNGDNYANSFAPSCPAAGNLPKILKKAYPDAQEGQYAIINYNNSNVDPEFQKEPEPEEPFELSNVIKTSAKGDAVTISGYVSALSTQGFVLTDASGSIFVFRKGSEPFADLKVGTEITLKGTVSVNNYGKQIDSGSTYAVKGQRSVTYPAPTVLTGADLEAMKATADAAYQADKNAGKNVVVVNPYYVSVSGKVAVNGNNINLTVAGADKAQGSIYGASDAVKAALADGSEVTVDGYLVAIAGGRYFNIVVTKVNGKTVDAAAAPSAMSRAVVNVPSEQESAVYYYDGKQWTAPSDMAVLNHADYQAMGQSHDNLSGTAPETMIPVYLRTKFPYAQAYEVKFVVFAYYNGSATVTRCARCIFDGSTWTGGFNGANYVTSQFVKKDGKWNYSPDVEITLPAGRGIEISTLYFQACVDWVKNNVPDGSAYISSYGNNDYYTGASAYQGNVDLRPSAAKAAYAGYDSMSDDEVVALLKTRFEKEVFPAVLAELHPDAAPTPKGIEPEYIINFYYYDGSTHPATITYKVTGVAKFEYVSCTWND